MNSDRNQLSWFHVFVLGTLVLLVLAKFPVEYIQNLRQRQREQWPTTAGFPTETRVVEMPPSRSFIQTLYVGECLVRYSVAGQSYSAWVGSGYMDTDRTFVESRLVRCPIDRYLVHYNSKNPSDSFVTRPTSSSH
jgi:hypothetical protein